MDMGNESEVERLRMKDAAGKRNGQQRMENTTCNMETSRGGNDGEVHEKSDSQRYTRICRQSPL